MVSERTFSLAALIMLADYDGNWEHYLEVIYQQFRLDFLLRSPAWPGKRWAMKKYPVYDGKEATFWHLVSEGSDESSRTPDLRRCERIRWPRRIIDANGHAEVKAWKNRRGRNQRIVLATNDFAYVVVLEERPDFGMLWTAYPVEMEHQRRKLRMEHEGYVNSLKG